MEREYKKGSRWVMLCCPWTYKVLELKGKWQEEIDEFVQWCAETEKPAFISQYYFTRADPANKIVDRDSATLDKITLDIDGDTHVKGLKNPLEVTKNAIRVLNDRVVDCNVYYSGNSGFAIEIPFPKVRVKQAHRVVRQLYDKLNDMFSIEADKQAQLGAAQKFRIVNSRHQKSGLYKIPLDKNELWRMNMAEIRELAKKPRAIEEVPRANESQNVVFTEVCRLYSKNMKPVKMTADKRSKQYKGYMGNEGKLRPCTQYMVDNKIATYTAMSMVAFEMCWLNFPDEVIHAWSKDVLPDKYEYGITERQIRAIKSKMETDDLYLHGCARIKDSGYCAVPQALGLTDCENKQREQQKKEEKNNLQQFLKDRT